MSISHRVFSIALHPQTPPELLQFLDGYIDEHRGLKMIFCQNLSFDSAFVSAQAIRKGGSKVWEVQIPVGFVLAIGEASQDKKTLGFLPQNQ